MQPYFKDKWTIGLLLIILTLLFCCLIFVIQSLQYSIIPYPYLYRYSFSRKIPHDQDENKTYTDTLCACLDTPANFGTNKSIKVESYCSHAVSFLGLNQRVISYSFFRVENETMTRYDEIKGHGKNFRILLQQAKLLYPGWHIRIYTNQNPTKSMCQLCKTNLIHWCRIEEIPGYENLIKVNPRIWRFMPIGDPTVSKFISRDDDSKLSLRERIAVFEWENSNKTLHVMRDHPGHNVEILAGIWGFNNDRVNITVRQEILSHLLKEGMRSQAKGLDQELLLQYVFKRFANSTMAHDSFHCEHFKEFPAETRPFPMRREGHDRVADVFHVSTWRNISCPIECRPTYGKDWTYC